jgi:restriction endonuclease S subunit
LADTLHEKDAIAKIAEQIDALIENAAPLHEEIKKSRLSWKRKSLKQITQEKWKPWQLFAQRSNLNAIVLPAKHSLRQ